MIAQISTLLALLAASAVAAPLRRVTLDPTLCYTLTSGGEVNYLDSASSVLDVEAHPDRQALIDQNDKGVRFQFPGGEGGAVVNQAHADHFVGLSGTDWRTDVGSQTVGRASVTSSGTGVVIQSGPAFIGADGKENSNAFVWEINEIPCANLD